MKSVIDKEDKVFLKICEIKAQIFRVVRHISVVKNYIVRKRYGTQKILSVEQGRKVLCEAIKKGEPFMAARFGTSEGAALFSYHKSRIMGNEYPEYHMKEMCNNAGFFPNDKELLFRWAELETDACRDVDLLGIMNFIGEEWVARTYCSNAALMPNSGLASATYGWAHVLEGKKVLVIHPFAQTIEKQYKERREEIFPGTNALPLFDLQCIKAVQTIADSQDDRFADWFEALDYMTEEVRKREFEVALIGCGAYGFALASRIKRMGKIAVHMGGPLQTLFGIKGGRWDNTQQNIYNDSWVYPSEEETPKGFEKVEGGCYWGPEKK